MAALYLGFVIGLESRSQWPRGLRLLSAAARLPRLWVRIPPGAWMSVVECCVCFQVEVSATSWSLVQRSTTDCGASLCVYSRNLMNEEALARIFRTNTTANKSTTENCALLGYYAASSGNFLPIGCPETSVINYHYSFCNNPEQRSSQLLRGGSLKSRRSTIVYKTNQSLNVFLTVHHELTVH